MQRPQGLRWLVSYDRDVDNYWRCTVCGGVFECGRDCAGVHMWIWRLSILYDPFAARIPGARRWTVEWNPS